MFIVVNRTCGCDNEAHIKVMKVTLRKRVEAAVVFGNQSGDSGLEDQTNSRNNFHILLYAL